MDMLPSSHSARSQTIELVLAHCPKGGYAYAGMAVTKYDRNTVPYSKGAWCLASNGQACIDGSIGSDKISDKSSGKISGERSGKSKNVTSRLQCNHHHLHHHHHHHHHHPFTAEGTLIKICYSPAKKIPKGERTAAAPDTAAGARATIRARRQTQQGGREGGGGAEEIEQEFEQRAGVMEWWSKPRGGAMVKQQTMSGIDEAGQGVQFCVGGYGSGVAWRIAVNYR
jgi:hypothetical protein